MPILDVLLDWQAGQIEAVVRALAEAEGVKMVKIAQPLRAGLTGKTVSPGIFDIFQILGREESMARLTRVAKKVS
jgi:glutamyl-tRNA synthetase